MEKFKVIRSNSLSTMEEMLDSWDEHNYEPVGPVVFLTDANGNEGYLATLKLKEDN